MSILLTLRVLFSTLLLLRIVYFIEYKNNLLLLFLILRHKQEFPFLSERCGLLLYAVVLV